MGSPTCWPACRTIPPGASTNSCLGIGALRASLTPPERNCLSTPTDLTKGRRRMRTSYATYCNQTRTHLSLNKDSPVTRLIEAVGSILRVPILGGWHHQYVRI